MLKKELESSICPPISSLNNEQHMKSNIDLDKLPSTNFLLKVTQECKLKSNNLIDEKESIQEHNVYQYKHYLKHYQ